uniref:(northern house mosquito) hypothetical protein n=1 Tax=Culex pipiens TaxID=7175 RepID=A0A8D8E9X8_CULPI
MRRRATLGSCLARADPPGFPHRVRGARHNLCSGAASPTHGLPQMDSSEMVRTPASSLRPSNPSTDGSRCRPETVGVSSAASGTSAVLTSTPVAGSSPPWFVASSRSSAPP